MRINESENIAKTIKFILHGPLKECKEYQRELFKNIYGHILLNGYEFTHDTYSIIVWKGKQDEFGCWEPYYKVVPRKVDDDIEAMKKILDAQKWTLV